MPQRERERAMRENSAVHATVRALREEEKNSSSEVII
jgi:hypothetical protein